MQSGPYIVPLLIIGVLAALLALIVWRRRSAPGAIPLIILLLGVAQWSLTYALSLTRADLSAQLLLANLAYVGIGLVPASWLAFALEYVGRGALLTRRRLAMLAVMPIWTLVMAWTNELHHLFRTEVHLVDTGSSMILVVTLGPAFWVHTAYSYLLLGLGSFLLLRNIIRLPHVYRRQAGALLVAVCAPLVGNALYLSGLNPFPYLDLTPFAFSISGIALAWDLVRFHLLEIVPVARGTILDNMDDGVIVLDADNRIVDINPAAQRLTNQNATAVIGLPAEQVFAEWRDIVEQYRQVNEAHEELTFETDGVRQSFDLHISPLYDRHARLTGRIVVLRDISERKQVAEELRRQNEALIRMADENARLYIAVQQELSERKQAELSLYQAKEAAEVANRAKSRFLGNMSHELRTPLTAILGYADLLQLEVEQRDDSAFASNIKRIQLAGRHLLGLISDILDLTQIEADKVELHPEYFDIAQLVDSIGATVRPLAEKNGNSFSIQCPDTIGMMYADVVKVQQILLNLLGNAAKFTEHGSIRLIVDIDQGAGAVPRAAQPMADDASAYVIFRIADTGIGMSLEQQRQLFKEFVQVYGGAAQKYGGSGLGLVISHRLCQLMGGDIHVSSDLGQGSTFTVKLPISARAPAIAETSRDTKSDAQAEAPTYEPRTLSS